MPLRKLFATVLCFLVLPVGLPAQQKQASESAKPVVTKAAPETPEQFAARKLALQEMLQRLTTTGRILQVVAHPDDEDGAMLTLESRVKGNTAMLFTFTRGEGGQNAQGPVFFDELGILRTLELLAADKEYGAEERFSHVADFGFSKSAQESFAKWGGEDVPLKDLVEQVRLFQPDVLVSRFSGTPKDGHGHHQASGLMTIKAFHDAADPKRFSGSGVPKWQPLKLYTGLAGDEATLVPDENQPSPLLGGKTPAQIALEGLRHQESQGLGNIERRGPLPRQYSSYKLVETADDVPKREHESDFFEGIDTSIVGLSARFPQSAAALPETKAALLKLQTLIEEARSVAPEDPESAIAPLTQALELFAGPLNFAGDDPFVVRLDEKERQVKRALILALGVSASLETAEPGFATPGEHLSFDLDVTNKARHDFALTPRGIELIVSSAGTVDILHGTSGSRLAPGMTAEYRMSYVVPENAKPTRTPFHRDSPVRDTVYSIDPGRDMQLPPPPIVAEISINAHRSEIAVTAPAQHERISTFIAPPVSITVIPTTLLRRLNQPHVTTVQVSVQNNSRQPVSGTVALDLPKGWTSDPAQQDLSVASSQTTDANFTVGWPAAEMPMQSTLKANFTSAGKAYSENYHLISRVDLPDAFPYYAPAQTTVSLINADIPDQHNVGYIMGAGDTLPDQLTSLGFTVHLLTAEDLASGDLKQYDTIVTGVRAYATRPDLREHNQRLLDYVKNGGTFVVQYEQDFNAFNSGHYTPYPATLGRDRVSQEEQPVAILDPQSQVFRYPNHIIPADFDNWVQERGLYFMKEWSSDYTPLLEMHDAGEAPLKGGLLLAHYGNGTYIYTGLSFYRELPNGVPGATRLFINLLAAGHNPAEQPVVNASR